MTPDERADVLAAVAVELVGERFGPAPLPEHRDDAALIAERRRILVGDNTRKAVARRRDRELTEAIRRWSA